VTSQILKNSKIDMQLCQAVSSECRKIFWWLDKND